MLIVFAKSFAFWRETRSLQSLREAQAADIKTRELLSSYLWAKESRIYGASEHFLARWQQLNQRLTEEKGAAERRNLWVAFGFDSLTYLCYGVIMVFAVYDRLGSGAPAAVGGIVVLFAAMDSIFTNINTVVMQFGNLFKNASLWRFIRVSFGGGGSRPAENLCAGDCGPLNGCGFPLSGS